MYRPWQDNDPITMQGEVAWTPTMRQRVFASRKVPNPAYLREVAVSIGTEEANYPLVAEHWYDKALYYWKGEKRQLEWARAGVGNAPDGWRRATDDAIAWCERLPEKMPPDLPDLETEVALVTLELCPVFTAMPWWLARHGPSFALRALCRCHTVYSSALDYGYRGATWIVDGEGYADYRPEYFDTAWHLLRGTIAALDEPAYVELRDQADEIRRNASDPLAALLAFAFPTEAAWARAAVPAAVDLVSQVKKSHYSHHVAFLACAASPDDAVGLVEKPNGALGPDVLLTGLAHHGAGATPVLAAALASAKNNDTRRLYASLLARVWTDEAQTILASFSGNKAVQEIALEHQERLAKWRRGDSSSSARPARKKVVRKKKVVTKKTAKKRQLAKKGKTRKAAKRKVAKK